MNMSSKAGSSEADVLRCGYSVGYFSKSDIARWADRQIAAIDTPCKELLDVSMIRNTHPRDVMGLLRSLGSAEHVEESQNQIGFIGLLYEKQEITTPLAIRALFALVHEPGTTEDEKSIIYHLDAGIDLAIAGTFGTVSEIERELMDFLSPYAKRLADQYPNLMPPTTLT